MVHSFTFPFITEQFSQLFGTADYKKLWDKIQLKTMQDLFKVTYQLYIISQGQINFRAYPAQDPKHQA